MVDRSVADLGRSQPPDGLLVVDKPRGPTSHDVVFRMRRALNCREIGHAGTLDPMATGVLVLAIGEATKLVVWLQSHEKSYEATIALGSATDTLDADGRETHRAPIGDRLKDALAQSTGAHPAPYLLPAFDRERARTIQVPPQFSAIKASGERAFDRARRGVQTALPGREVVVHRLDLIGCSAQPPSLSVSVTVSKGYYVRALARDLAESLGTGGHLTYLRRTRSGPFALEESVRADVDPATAIAHIQPLATVAPRVLRVARLNDEGTRDAVHGRPVRAADITAEAPGPCAWLDERGTLVAVGDVDAEGRGRVIRGFTRR
jgi:tRNA pseudouridine55 synthase